jgi:hypothetical protein
VYRRRVSGRMVPARPAPVISSYFLRYSPTVPQPVHVAH